MKAPGDIGWKKWRKFQEDPARRRCYAQGRSRRYRDYLEAMAVHETPGLRPGRNYLNPGNNPMMIHDAHGDPEPRSCPASREWNLDRTIQDNPTVDRHGALLGCVRILQW